MSSSTLFDAEPAPILAATAWATNGDLVAALHALGHLPDGRVLDPTYGRGLWWTRWKPAGLVAGDITTGTDVRALPFPNDTFDAAVYDPPHLPSYALPSSTEADFRDRYGLTELRNDAGIAELYRAGIAELARVLKPGGRLTVKTTDYVNGRIYRPMAARAVVWLEDVGFDVVDTLIMLRAPGPTSNNVRTATSRRNYSTATVGRLRHRKARR